MRTLSAVVFVVLVPFAQSLHAQTAGADPPPDGPSSQEGLTFGVKAGLNLASLRNDDGETDRRAAPAAGAFAAWQTGSLVGVQVEALYSPKGIKQRGPNGNSLTIEMDYLEVPVLVTFKVPGNGAVQPLLLTGPAVGIKVRTKFGSLGEGLQEKFADFVRRWDVGWVVGAGLDLPLARGGLIVEGRYTLGLTTVFDADPTDSDRDDKNQVLALLVGYRF